MQDTNLNQCYQAALLHASDITEECNGLSDDFAAGSDLYKNASFTNILIDLFLVAVGFGMMLSGLIALFNDNSFDIWKLSFSGQFVGVLLMIVGVVSLFTGGFSIFKCILLARAKHNAKVIRKIGTKVDQEAKLLEQFEQKLQMAIAKGEDLMIQPSALLETQVIKYKTSVAERRRNDDKKNQLIHTIAAGLLFLFAEIAFYPFIIGGYALKYGHTSGALVATAYVVLAVIISESLYRLDRWYRAEAKIVAGAAFGLYQVAVILGLLVNKTFANLAAGDSGEKWMRIVLSYPFVSLLLTSAVMAFIIVRVRYDRIVFRMGESSYERIMTDGTTRTEDLQEMKCAIRYRCMFSTPLMIAMGIWMGKIAEKGWSFGSILRYLLIAVVYITIMAFMDLDDNFNYVYGRLPKYLRLLMFAGYITVALSVIPELGIGTAILVGSMSLASMGGSATPQSVD